VRGTTELWKAQGCCTQHTPVLCINNWKAESDVEAQTWAKGFPYDLPCSVL
jgi:hypothetical protein